MPGSSIHGLPIIKSATVREFFDALETLHRLNLQTLAQQPDEALSPEGIRLKRAYIALRDLDTPTSMQRRCAQLAATFPIDNDGIHPDVSWADTREPIKTAAWTTAQQIADAIEAIGGQHETD